MVISNKEKDEIIELEKLSQQGIKNDELEDVVSEYQSHSKKMSTHDSFEAVKEKYKREKAKENFENGAGGFKRAK
jgi:hypothetical protein